jgi:hypothetical protein
VEKRAEVEVVDNKSGSNEINYCTASERERVRSLSLSTFTKRASVCYAGCCWLAFSVHARITIHVRVRGRSGWVRAGRRQRRRRRVKILMEILMRCREPAPRFARVTKGQQTRRRALTQSFALECVRRPAKSMATRENPIKVGGSRLSIHAAGPRIEWRARGHLKMNEHAKCKPVFLIRRGVHFHSERCQMCDAGTPAVAFDVKIDPHKGGICARVPSLQISTAP